MPDSHNQQRPAKTIAFFQQTLILFQCTKDDCQHGDGVKCMYTITSTFHTCHLYNIA